MSDPQEQIKRWLAERLKPHGAATKLARHMGVADTAVTRMKNLEPADAKARRQIKPHEIKQIAEFFNELPPGFEGMTSWITPVRETHYAPNPDDDHTTDTADELERDGVSTLKPYKGQIPGASPDIDVSAGAGPGGLPLPASIDHGGVIYSADAVRGEIVLPGYLLSDFTRAPGVRVHWLKVRGDSMKPTLEDGDRVMVDTTDTAFGQGGIFVLRDPDGEVLVKRLRKLPGGKIELVSDNRIQGDMTHDVADVLVIGRVVGRLGRL